MTMGNRFPQIVSLACHDLRTPLATVYGFARTLTRAGEVDDRTLRFVQMIEDAAVQMTQLLDELGAAARVEGGRFEPVLAEVDTAELVTSSDERISGGGVGEVLETDVKAVRRSLEALAVAAIRYGPSDRVTWKVLGRVVELSPVTGAAGPVVTGSELRDLGALVARAVIETLGGSLELDGETLRVRL